MLTLSRDSSQFSEQTFDILVIGGGINGAACAWDAALRGLSVALIEKGDFGGASSAGCFKIVHGGLRYLQHLNIARLKESVEEQRVLRQIAPHLVRPLPFLVPAYGFGMRGKEVLGVGMRLYELLTSGRNRDVAESHRLPNHRVLSREKCLSIAPGLKREGLRGGLVYYDCQMSNCDRLTFAVVQSAALAGAKVCNYLEATGFECSKEQERSTIRSVSVRDALSGKESRIRAKLVLNATGPWSPLVEKLLPGPGSERPVYYSKGIQLVTKAFVSDYALAIESKHSDSEAKVSRGGRSYFVHPWRGCSLVGTADAPHTDSPESYCITKEEVQSLLSNLSEMYQEPSLKMDNVLHAFGGLRPMASGQLERMRNGYQPRDDEADVSMKEEIIDHAEDYGLEHPRAENLISLVGVKYTTFRAFAEEVVNRCVKKLQASASPCATKATALYGARLGEGETLASSCLEAAKQHGPELVSRLVRNYGTRTKDILQLIEGQPELGSPLADGCETIAAEVLYVARFEMAVALEDVCFRRTGLGTLGYPGEQALERAADILASELDWDSGETAQQIDASKRAFPMLA